MKPFQGEEEEKRHGYQVLWNEDIQRTALKGNASASGSERFSALQRKLLGRGTNMRMHLTYKE